MKQKTPKIMLADRMILGSFDPKNEGPASSMPERFHVGRFLVCPVIKTKDAAVFDIMDGDKLVASRVFVTLEKPASVTVVPDRPPVTRQLTISLCPVDSNRTYIDAKLS